MSDILPLESVQQKFLDIIATDEWVKVEDMFGNAVNVYIFGNGGNMGVADHAAIDIGRLTDKATHAPGSAVLATSIISDTNFEDWFKNWLDIQFRGNDTTTPSLVIGLSCSTIGASSNSVLNALQFAANKGHNAVLIAAKEKENIPDGIVSISQECVHYHTSEILSLMMMYQLIHSAGFKCPTIKEKADERCGPSGL